MVELTEQQLARQRKQIEKNRRRKVYDDLQVQGTNNSSIVSKRSVEKLYSSKLNPEIGEWFQYFVPKGKRRSPAINRGYWIRMESIKQMVTRIIAKNPNTKVQVINLGCGFDPLPFQLLNENPNKIDYEFLDIDFPELIQNKYDMIKNAQPILDIIKYQQENAQKTLGLVMSTENYQLIGCDLKDFAKYQHILTNLLQPDSLKIFIAEVSLAYMEPKDANEIIEISSKFPQTHFLILEQCLPQGKQNSFAKKMIYHFEHLRHPIKCIGKYPQSKDQINRFSKWFPHVELANLFENWKFLINENLKLQIEAIEEFDEWEEFIIFCQHYTICHATNQQNQMIYPTNDVQIHDLKSDDSFTITIDDTLNEINLKFPALASADDQIIIHGGLCQTRTNETIMVKNNEILRSIGPSSRMAHTMTNINGKIILIGGRTRPGNDLDDIYLHDGSNWTLIGKLPYGVSRHSTVAINDHEVLILSETGFVIYNIDENKSIIPETNIDLRLSSCSMVAGYILGGMVDRVNPTINDKLYHYTLINHKIIIKEIDHNQLFSRLGCQMQVIKDKLIIVGGVNTDLVFNESTNIISYNIATKEILSITFPQQLYEKYPPMLIGFGSTKINDKIKIAGGGAVCYSFGSVYNHGYNINLT